MSYCSTCKYQLNITQRKLTTKQQLMKIVSNLKHCEKVLNKTHNYHGLDEGSWFSYRLDLKTEITFLHKEFKK